MQHSTTHSNFRIITFFVATAILLCVLGQAHAGDDYKFYPATTCFKFDPAKDKLGYYGAGHVRSWRSDRWVYIACPIIRDMTAANDSIDVSVMTSNPNQGASIICWLSIRSPYGSDVWTGYWTPGPAQVIRLYGPQDSGSDNTYILGCALPPGVNGQYPVIKNYVVYERE